MRESIEDLRSCCRVFGGFEGTARGLWRDVLFVWIEFVCGYLNIFEFEWNGVERGGGGGRRSLVGRGRGCRR